MIIHVYNPQQLSKSPCKSTTDSRPPPSPRLLRNPTSKIINTLANKLTKSSCSPHEELIAKPAAQKNLKMNQDSDSQSWAPRNNAHQGPQQDVHATCTCRCNPTADLNSSSATSHYMTPSSSFHSNSEETPNADSLEYIPVKKSPSPGRALDGGLHLGRILSPRSGRKVFASSSPNPNPNAGGPGLREKSISPITSPGVVDVPASEKYFKLSNSMSNTSIQSNFSEDSLQACKNTGCCNSYNSQMQYCPRCIYNPRWNENQPDASHLPSPTWNVRMGVATTPLLNTPLATNYRPATTLTTTFNDSPSKSDNINDFSKDSLNTSTSILGNSSIVSPAKEVDVSSKDPAGIVTALAAEEECPSAAAAKLEPLAFTIDFGTPNRARKETPKRFTERLAASNPGSGHKRNPSLQRNEDRKVETAVDVETASTSPSVSSFCGDKMVKSSSRMAADPVTAPFAKYDAIDDVDAGRRTASSLNKNAKRTNTTTSSSRHSSLTRNNSDRVKSSPAPRHRRTPSPPPSALTTKTPAVSSDVPTETDERDDVSEAGTYTIDKDSPSPDEEQSRRDIDRVFGVYKENGLADGPVVKDSETHNNSQNWIQEWAAQVVQQQQEISQSPASSKPPLGPLTRPQADSQRPRRRLPSVPPSLNSSSRSRSSPRPSEVSDPSDSSLETESYLRDTESVVSAMQARVDGRSSTESDVEVRSNIGRRLSAQLRAKIRSLDESYVASGSSSAGSRSLLRETSYVVETPSVIHNELRTDDAKSLNSDSSSDITPGDNGPRSGSRNAQEDSRNSAPTIRYNRALSLRRGRLGLDADSSPAPNRSKERRQVNVSPSRGTSPQVKSTAQQPANQRKVSTPLSPAPTPPVKAQATPTSGGFSRNDGGRFSLRIGTKTNSSTPTNNVAQPPRPKSSSKGNQATLNNSGASQKTPGRSNSTLSSKEAEFQNWKRRKNYDPMKAAAEGRKKEAARRAVTITMSQSMIGPVTSQTDTPSSDSPSPPPRSIIRSASFTCVNNDHFLTQQRSADPGLYNPAKTSNRHKMVQQHQQHSVLYSSEEESDVPLSHKRPSPSPPRKYFSAGMSSLPSPGPSSGDFADLNPLTPAEIDLTLSPGSPRRKLYMEEGHLLRSSASNSSLRARTKLEALDNLVISTIHGLSGKIKTSAQGLLRKLRSQYTDDVERFNLIEETMARLSEAGSDSPVSMVPNGRSNSRELAGTLKIMKRVEQVFHVLDQLLFEEALEGGGEESVILGDGVNSEADDWNTYTSGEFY